MKTVAIIQARLGSTRLPRKSVAEVAGRPLINHVIERAKAITNVDQVILNVPEEDEKEFRSLVSCVVVGIKDQQKNLLASYVEIAKMAEADVVVRITGDCPLLDPGLCKLVIELFHAMRSPCIYCANDTLRSGYPDGTDVEVTSVQALQMAARDARTREDREHVMPWIRRTFLNYGIMAPMGVNLRNVKWSVDTLYDLQIVRKIASHLPAMSYSWAATEVAWRTVKKSVRCSVNASKRWR